MFQNVPSKVVQPLQVWHEPAYYQDFECLGAACEDTCCGGWGIGVDRQTFESYGKVQVPDLGPKLQRLVVITPPTTSGAAAYPYAKITLEDGRCPFLSENLCSIQKELGEDHLGQACATFPRVVHQVAGAIERSLDVSCPEVARMALLKTDSMVFQEFTSPIGLVDSRLVAICEGREIRRSHDYFDAVRSFAISILQNRTYPIEKRMLLLGHLCSKLSELEESGTQHLTGQVLEGFRFAIAARMFDEHLAQTSAEPSSQLAIVLELVVGRVSLDYTSQRYRDLYREFMEGLELKPHSTIEELGERYSNVYSEFFVPYLEEREYVLEHYLVSYAYKNLFPFGTGSIASQYLVMASYFAITRALAVGLSGYHRSSFGDAHMVRAVQVCARALEHCTSYPSRVLEILASKGILVPGAMAVLTQDPKLIVTAS